MVTNYAREAYLAVSLLLISNWRIYGKLVKDMGNIYETGQDNYHRTLPKMLNILANWQNSAGMAPRLLTGCLAFVQKWTHDVGIGTAALWVAERC